MLEPGTGPPCDAGLEPELERLGHWMRETPDPELPTSLLERPPAPPAGRLRQTAAAGGRLVLEGEPSSAAWHRLGGRAFIRIVLASSWHRPDDASSGAPGGTSSSRPSSGDGSSPAVLRVPGPTRWPGVAWVAGRRFTGDDAPRVGRALLGCQRSISAPRRDR